MRRLSRLLLVLLFVAGSVSVHAQADLTAQILNFWRVLQNGTVYQFTNLDNVAGAYMNFGATLGVNGYGFRDSGGSVQFKNANGSWATFSGGGGNANALYWLATADATMPNAKVLGSLGTGLVLSTTSTGVPSIYGGTSCTNQFPRSLNASGAATCASVALATDVSGTLAAGQVPALAGDVTTAGGTLTTVLATVNSNVGSFGSATAIPAFTVNAKGLITAASATAPQLTLTSTYFSSLAATNLTGIPGANITGTLATVAVPAFTGDVTTAGGSLATTVAKIGGNVVTLGGALTTSGANPLTFTTTGSTSITLPTSGTMVTSTVSTLSSLVSIGTITTGVWTGTVIGPTYGGTGVNNGSATLTLGGNTAFSGAFATTITVTAPTTVTLPTSGTLQIQAGPFTGQFISASASSPTVANVGSNSCGTTAATIAGNDNAWAVTVGATSGTQCRVAFAVAATTEWDCAANDQTTAVAVRSSPVDTTHTDLLGSFTAADKLVAVCLPR